MDMDQLLVLLQNLGTDMQSVKADMQSVKTDMQSVKADMQSVKIDLESVKTTGRSQNETLASFERLLRIQIRELQNVLIRLNSIEFEIDETVLTDARHGGIITNSQSQITALNERITQIELRLQSGN
jgi:chromosome segregation ATPase